MLRLFIENRELDLDKSVQVAVTKQFEDLTNPTVIINDWSKTVSIPFTAKNNSIFGHIYNVDRLIAKNDDPNQPLTGIYFDPYKKLDMRLQWGDAVVMYGYAKIDSITKKDGKGTYNMTLFGQLGRVLQEMQKVTFDEASPDTDYIIDGSEWVAEYINKDLVYDSWHTSEPYYYNAYKKGNGANRAVDFIGFAPNNSYVEDFDYETYQSSTGATAFADTLDAAGIQSSVYMKGDTIIGDGLLPREIGEYRSYHQLPFIFWHKLWQIWQDKCESVTGYKFDLDPTWFSYNNPYYGRLVMMLSKLNTDEGHSVQNRYEGRGITELCWSKNQGQLPYSTVQSLTPNMAALSEKAERLVPGEDKFIVNLRDNINITDNTLEFYITGEMNHAHDILFTKDNAFLAFINFVGENGKAYTKQAIVYRADTDNADVKAAVSAVTGDTGYAFQIGYDDRYGKNFPNLQSSSKYGWRIIVGGGSLVNFNQHDWGSYVTVSVTYKWLNNHTVFGAAQGSSTSELCWVSNQRLAFAMDVQEGVFESNSYFTLNDLWNSEVSLFDTMLNYCKMFRIGVSVNEVAKTIEFKPIWKYFEGWRVTDWTNKLDMTKDFTITPVTFEDKYVLFNYEDNETKLGEEYREKYGVDYGEYRIKTDYNFNTEENELFEGLHTGIVNTDNVLSWTTLYELLDVVYSFPAEIYVDCKDDDGKYVDQFGALFFHCGVTQFSTEADLHMRSVTITDDTDLMLNTNKFFYGQNQAPRVSTTSYPHLDVVYGDNCVLFNTPMENYTYKQNYSGKMSIYDNFWDEYIVERYNIQNKKITCYANIKPLDYVNFNFKNFVKVGNQMCMVNKIYDYDVQGTGSTKVDLVTIQNPDAYVTNPFKFDYIQLSSKSLTIPYDHYKKVTVYSTRPWELRDNEYSETCDIWPTSGNSGTTTVYVGSIDEERIIGQLEFIQINPDAETASDYYTDVWTPLDLDMSPASVATIDTNPWYNEVVRGGTKQATVTSTGGTWRVSAVNKPAGASSPVSVQPTTGGNGTTTLTFMTTDTTALGVYDYFLENASGDIQTVRLYVTAS